MAISLSNSFLKELFKLCFYKESVISTVTEHLKYEYIPKEYGDYKAILKAINTYYSTNQKLPSFGIISQTTQQTSTVQSLLDDIKKCKLIEETDGLKLLEDYLRKVKFEILHKEIVEMYNNGEQEKAIQHQATESEKIVNFSINKSSKKFEKIFGNFQQRSNERDLKRLSEQETHLKVPFGLLELDLLTHGGTEEGETDLFIGMSGSGKTTWLIHRGIAAARRGFKVLHISAEDSKERILAKYDAAWSAIPMRDIRFNNINKETEDKLRKIVNDILNKKSEIDVVAFEQFDSASMKDVRELVIEYIKINGCKPDLILLDYLEKFNPGDGKRYSVSTEGEKMRRQAVADKMKNISMEFKSRVATAIQTGDIPPDFYNRPENVITRHNASGDRNIVNPFSYVFTFNTTTDEKKKRCARFYIDKLRDYESGQKLFICTNFAKNRFYDHNRTIELFGKEDVE